MKVNILFFGHLTDKVGSSSISLDNPGSISKLKAELFSRFPALQTTTFSIALNNEVISEETTIPENSIIACMPPFSGG